MEQPLENDSMTIERFCREAIESLGLELAICGDGSCRIDKELASGEKVLCWFAWAESRSQKNLFAYPANFDSVEEDLFPLLLGIDISRTFWIREFFWRDEDGLDCSAANPFLGCKSLCEAKIKLDLIGEFAGMIAEAEILDDLGANS